jgi:hypothetical protein
MPERICADCYCCLSWDRETWSCNKGVLSVPGEHCYGHSPIPEPEPCELEQGILFVEVDKL